MLFPVSPRGLDATYPPLDLELSEETQARLPEVAGGISTALAQAFTIVEPRVKNPGRPSGSAPSVSSTSCCDGGD